MLASKLQAGDPKFGLMYELEVIADVVVGGTSLLGGSGKILGTLIGAFIKNLTAVVIPSIRRSSSGPSSSPPFSSTPSSAAAPERLQHLSEMAGYPQN